MFLKKINRSVGINAINNNAPAHKQELEAIAPNGWAKKLYVDEKGQIRFTPLWAGKYMADFHTAKKLRANNMVKPMNRFTTSLLISSM